MFQHTATRRWLLTPEAFDCRFLQVSTHSHPKVAACFVVSAICKFMFQHTATRRWLRPFKVMGGGVIQVSTHSHPKVAAFGPVIKTLSTKVSTHSHPKVAAHEVYVVCDNVFCFNTQPPEGGCRMSLGFCWQPEVSTHSHPKVAASRHLLRGLNKRFQHTATRRWLLNQPVSTLSSKSFNTQPPEGGCPSLCSST